MGASLLLALGRTDILSSLLLTLSEQLAWQVRSAINFGCIFSSWASWRDCPAQQSIVGDRALRRSARRRALIQPTAGVE
jgi:hypothetical protein